jgi:hypothetical protein
MLLVAAGSGLRADDGGASACGSLAWIGSDRLDLVGTIDAELPIATIGRWRLFSSLSAVTAIEKATSDFTFLVDEVGYGALVGGRRALGEHGAVEGFVGERGAYLVDAAGHVRVRVVGAAWESERFHGAYGPFGWSGRVAAAAVVEHLGLSASAVVTGTMRYVGAITDDRRLGLGAEAGVDALIGGDGGTDATVGPRLDVDLGGDRRFGLFVRYLHGGNPLGLRTNGVMAGFDFAQGLFPERARAVPPEIFGRAAAGAGDGRALASIDLHVATPPFLGGTVAEVDVDGNVLTGSDENDLYYLYDVGFAHPVAAWRAGVWFHHRSNHVLGAYNPTITSINVLEAGITSDGWDRAEPSGWVGRAGAIDASLRAGWLIDSSFGEDVGWHARGGVRWASPELGPVRLYAQASLEEGDVEASAYAVGALLPRGWDLRFEARHDQQLFSADKRARLAVATLRY